MEPTPEELDLVSDVFQVTYPGHVDQCPVIIPGDFQVGQNFVDVGNVLFDSGALQASYVSKKWVDANRAGLKSQLRRMQGRVRMPDGETVVSVTERLRTIATFEVRGTGEKICGLVDFWVLDMGNSDDLDAIIGLPDILRSYMRVFVQLLEDAAEMVREGSLFHISSVEQKNRMASVSNLRALTLDELREEYPDLEDTFGVPADELAPEEENTEEPCSFTGPLYYLSKPHEQVVEDYFAMFDKHISDEWRADPRIIALLRSDKALRVFVPKEWTGIVGIDPIELDFLPDMPTSHKPKARPLNPAIKSSTEVEFKRMCKYMYVESDSPIACPLLVAPKATAPFIRICGDYIWVNRWIRVGQYWIPHVMKELEKAAGYSHFMDIDMANSFHQLRLSKRSSEMLSVQTNWGTYRPLFVPEGISPASGFLQRTVMEIFSDFSDWCITLFDNILVLCNGLEDGLEKSDKILTRCDERNVVLKFAKSWIGFQECTFFGYKVRNGSYGLDQERKSAVMEMSMPQDTKAMQRFLGTALFFSEFIPHYSEATRLLYDMTKQDFIWDPGTWTEAYEGVFENVKQHLADSVEKHFPDYNLNWVLRCDASDYGVGAVLMQIAIVDGKEVYQPIGFKSKKFSGAASRWDTHKKEAYSLFFAVKSFAYYLRGKPFILENDHANLLYLAKSEVPIIIRWRVYLQSFQHLLRHIPGKKNVVADWASRMYHLLAREAVHAEQVEHGPTLGETELRQLQALKDGLDAATRRLLQAFPDSSPRKCQSPPRRKT